MGQSNRQPLLDVYLAAVPQHLVCWTVFSPARSQLLAETTAPSLKRQRWLAWHLLEAAAARSLGLDPARQCFEKNDDGRWSCPDFEFSLSHTEDAVAVAVSRAPVGVDVESLPRFARRCASRPALCASVLRRVAAPGEGESAAQSDAERLLLLWTGKESLFKMRQNGDFSPSALVCGEETRHLFLNLPPQVCAAVSSEALSSLRVFVWEAESIRPAELLPISSLRESLDACTGQT